MRLWSPIPPSITDPAGGLGFLRRRPIPAASGGTSPLRGEEPPPHEWGGQAQVRGDWEGRELALDLVHITESAALASAGFLGKGDADAVSEAAGEAMRHALERSSVSG